MSGIAPYNLHALDAKDPEMIPDAAWNILYFVGLGGVAALGYFALRWNNKIVVDPKGLAVEVTKNSLTGTMHAYGRGTWFLPPGETPLLTVPTTRQTLKIPPVGSTARGEPCMFAHNVRGIIECRLDKILGRRSYPSNTRDRRLVGRIQGHHPGTIGSPDDITLIDPPSIAKLIAIVNFDTMDEFLLTQVQGAIESVLVNYTAEDILTPEAAGPDGVEIPDNYYPDCGVDPKVCRTRAEVYAQLGALIHDSLCRRLADIGGLDIVDFQILQLELESGALQESTEDVTRVTNLQRAADLLRQKNPHMSEAEAWAAVVAPDQLGQVSIAGAVNAGLMAWLAWMQSGQQGPPPSRRQQPGPLPPPPKPGNP